MAEPNAARRGRGAVEGTPASARKRAPAAALPRGRRAAVRSITSFTTDALGMVTARRRRDPHLTISSFSGAPTVTSRPAASSRRPATGRAPRLRGRRPGRNTVSRPDAASSAGTSPHGGPHPRDAQHPRTLRLPRPQMFLEVIDMKSTSDASLGALPGGVIMDVNDEGPRGASRGSRFTAAGSGGAARVPAAPALGIHADALRLLRHTEAAGARGRRLMGSPAFSGGSPPPARGGVRPP